MGAALKRLRRIGQEPKRARQALERAALRLRCSALDEADLISDAAWGIVANRRIFHRMSGERG